MATQGTNGAATQSLPEVIPVPRGDLVTLGARLERVERGLTAMRTTHEAELADIKARLADVQEARKALATCGAAVKVTQLPAAGSGPAVQARVPVGTPGSLFDTARADAARDSGAYVAYSDSAAVAALVGEGCTEEFVRAHSAQRNGHGGKRPCPAVAAGNAGCACVRSLRASWQGAQRKASAPAPQAAPVQAPTAAPAPQTAPAAPVAPATDPMTLLADGTWLRLYRACLKRGMDDASAEAAAYAAIGMDDAADTAGPEAADVPAPAPAPAPPPAAPAARPVPTQAAYAAIREAFHVPAKQTYVDALYAARMNGAPDPDPTAYGVDDKVVRNVARRFAGAVK